MQIGSSKVFLRQRLGSTPTRARLLTHRTQGWTRAAGQGMVESLGGHGRPGKPVAESAVAKVKLAPGKGAVVTLTPKPMFAANLEAAKSLLVREVETVKGKTRTSYRRLKVIG